MRMPSGYGSVIKLPGKRRKPYAVRTSTINRYVCVYDDISLTDSDIEKLKEFCFKYKKKKEMWMGIVNDKSSPFINALKNKGIKIEIEYKQDFQYHAYFAKPELAHSYLADLNNGNAIPEHLRYTDIPTFAEMYEKWRVYKLNLKKQVSASTWRNYSIAFHHMSALHEKKFLSIKAEDLQNVLNQWNHKSASTIGNIRAILKGMYVYAVMNGYVDTDLTSFLVYEWTNNETEIHSPYTSDEIQILWDKLYEINNVDLILIYIYTGLRPSELLNILTSDVHLEEQYMIGGSKTESGKDRIIPIADKILPLVKRRYNPDNKYLIVNRNGGHYSYGSYVSANFNTVMNNLGFQHIPHDSRHTFATLMDNAGANPVCTKLILGHSMKNDVTLGTYTHKTVKDLLYEVNKI